MKAAPEERLSLSVGPERESLVCACFEKLGYRLESKKEEPHADSTLTFMLEDPVAFDSERMERCQTLLKKLQEIDRRVTRYFLQLDCLIGLIGAICIALSFTALRARLQGLFTILLVLGLFGCTITLYLRPLFTRMGRRKFAGEEPALLSELQALLDLNGEEARA